MIKTDAPFIQNSYQRAEVPVPDERRRSLANKGKLLYGKFCGTNGKGICSESFVEYHIWRGEYVVARDFLAFLYDQRQTLQQPSPANDEALQQLQMTEQLIQTVEALLGDIKNEVRPALETENLL